jgi:hypothetical protein
MKRPFRFTDRRLAGAAAVSGLLLVPLGVFGGSALARTNTPSAAQYQYKVTICHHTHSAKNPWVQITISNKAVAAHLLRHGDHVVPPACPTKKSQSSTNHGKPSNAGPSNSQGQGNGNAGGNHGNGNANGHHKS